MSKYFFQKLTPINNVEDMEVYTSALDFVFENDDLRNIAITGPYGAGKSSMIETYKTKRSYRFLHISLAHFEETGKTSLNTFETEGNMGIEKVLEGKILNQLLHQIDPKSIKWTSFRVKKDALEEGAVEKDIVKKAGYITFFMLLAFYLNCLNNWREFLLGWEDSFIRDVLLLTINPYILMIASVVFAGLLLAGIYKVIELQKYKNIFKKLKLGDKELELFEEHQDSYFDKYLNEVLYLFENSRADVIVFEDIDRFDIVEIFERLREINRLINERRIKEKKSVIRFFYLLRDDIFTNKDRTKFFDYMIPVIPVLNGSNAKEKFIAYFKKAGVLPEFDRVFLRDVSLYIDEMRLLQNIYNEYMIYSEKISGIGLDANKLLAMIIYKNIFPKDFNDLQSRQGYVYRVFEYKEEYIENIQDQKESEIYAKQKELQNLDNELLLNLDELDAMFFVFSQARIRINGTERSGFANNIDMIKMAKKNPSQIEYYYNGYNSGWRAYPFQEEYNNLSQNSDYIERKKRIEEKNNGKAERLKKEIADIRSDIEELPLTKLQDIITDTVLEKIDYTNPMNKKEEFSGIKESPYFRLLQYLLTNGWIDEAYPDYISYFYEGSINRLEKEFLLSIADKKAKPYNFEVNPSLELLNNLDIRDFSKEEIFNYSLLELLIKNKDRYKRFYYGFYELLENTENIKFVVGFYRYTEKPQLFVKSLNDFWPEVVRELIKAEEIPFEDKKDYLVDTILCTSKEELLELNEKNCITEFINEREDFVRVDDSDAEKVINGYGILDIRFETLIFDNQYQKMSIGIYQNSLYLLTGENIEYIFENILHEEETLWSWGNAATRILSKNETPICGYVRKNMDLFLYLLFENAKDGIEDEEGICLSILNDENISMEKRKGYVAQMKNIITHLSSVRSADLWDTVLECKAVPCTEENILTYYFDGKQEWTETLVEFINSGKERLNFDRINFNESYGKDARSIFWNCVIKCMKLDNQKYAEILLSMKLVYPKFYIQDLDEDKVEILIRNGIIRMTTANLEFMRENYEKKIICFAKSNITGYLYILTDELFSEEEMLALLDTDIHINYKKKLLDKSTARISVVGKKYQPTIKEKILKEHFDSNDLENLLSKYDSEDSRVQGEIKKIVITYIDDILDNEFLVALPLLRNLLRDEALKLSLRQQLLSQNISRLTQEDAMSELRELNLAEFLAVFEGKNPKFKKTVIADKILSSFYEKEWIGKIKEEEIGGIDYYRVYSKNSSKKSR